MMRNMNVKRRMKRKCNDKLGEDRKRGLGENKNREWDIDCDGKV